MNVKVEVTHKGAVYINDTRVTGRHTKWGVHNIVFCKEDVPNTEVRGLLDSEGYGHIKLEPDYAKEFGI